MSCGFCRLRNQPLVFPAVAAHSYLREQAMTDYLIYAYPLDRHVRIELYGYRKGQVWQITRSVAVWS